MSNKSIEGKSFLNNIVLGKKTKIFLRVLLWMEILVIGLYLLNIIFSYFITGSFEIQNPFIFHYDVWIILLDTSTLSSLLPTVIEGVPPPPPILLDPPAYSCLEIIDSCLAPNATTIAAIAAASGG